MDGTQVATAPRQHGIWLNWVIVIYTAIALAALFGIANLIIFDHNVRWDLTPNKRYSLSEFDKRVLDGIKQPVKVMAFIRTEDASYHELADLLNHDGLPPGYIALEHVHAGPAIEIDVATWGDPPITGAGNGSSTTTATTSRTSCPPGN